MLRMRNGCLAAAAFVLAVGVGHRASDQWGLPVIATDKTAPASAMSGVAELTALSGRPLFSFERLVGGKSAPVAFCFSPDTEPDVMAYYNEFMLTDPAGPRYFLGGRWSGGQGSPRALTWSFAPDGLSVDGGTNEIFSRMDSLFAGQGGRATWVGRFQQCFDRWAVLTGTSYTRITSGGNDWDDGAAWGTAGGAARGDVRIAMILIDGGGGVLAYNQFPSNGDMVLDRGDNWSSATNNNRFLRDVVMHEHGHGLGIFHVCSSNSNQLMEPFINTSFDGPQDDDLRAGQRHYGDPYEPNDSAPTAAILGTVEVGSPISIGAVPAPNITFASLLTLDADAENDYYRFSVNGARSGTITVTPIGRTYDSSPQNGDGSCASGNPVNSLTQANLSVQLIDGDGTTVLQTAAANPAGAAETMANAILSAGNYYVRVFEADAPTQAQFYTLSISVTNLDCNANGLIDPCDIDCGTPGGECDLPGCGQAADCNGNLLPDECEDCNGNGDADSCDIASATSLDCNNNTVPDECEVSGNDCNANNTPDDCDIAAAVSLDCNGNGEPDECDIASAASLDCNLSAIPDECELLGNDCNGNTVPDDCDIASAASVDCNADATPDECDIAANRDYDCNANGILDSCDRASGASGDCDSNGVPDECESETCHSSWDGFEPDPPFSTGAVIHGVDYDGDGVAWQNPSNAGTIVLTGCGTGTRALKIVTQVPMANEFYPLTSEYFRTVGGELQDPAPLWSLKFDARTEASLNPRIDWQMTIKDGRTNGNVMLIHWASTQSTFSGVSSTQKGRILVQNPAGSPAFLSSGFAIPANTCYSLEVRLNSVIGSVELYINGTLRVTTTPLQPFSARRVDYFRLEQRPNGQSTGNTSRLGLDNFSICQLGAELSPGGAPDCNANNIWDDCDIASGTSIDADANGTPDECEGVPAATVTGAVSRKLCDLTLIPSRQSEPRQGGVAEVRIQFNVPPGGPGPSPITLEQATCAAPALVPYAGASTSSAVVAGNELVLTFTPALENGRTYRMNLGAAVTSVPGQFVEVRGLVGDVNSDGVVNGSDRSTVVGVWTGGGFSCSTDVSNSGTTDAADRSIVVGAWTGAQSCAP